MTVVFENSMIGSHRSRSLARAAGIGCFAFGCVACSDGASPITAPGDAAQPDAAPSPACPTKSGYPGDELCIEPPPASKGIQLHYGPSSYDDPDVVAPFVIQPNEEISDCFFLKTPNDAEMPVGEFHTRMRWQPGATLIINVEFPDHPDGLGPCAGGAGGGTFFGGARSERFDSPPEGPLAPENVGLAAPLPARTQVAMTVHFENETSTPKLREVWVNLLWHDPETVTSGLAPIFFIGGLTMNVMPGATHLARGTAALNPAVGDVRLVGLVGHFHTHTRRFAAWKAVGNAPNDGGVGPPLDGGVPAPPDWGTGTRTLLAEAYDALDPGSRWFNSTFKNPTPNASTGHGGAISGPVELKLGDRIDWECEVVNDLTTPLQYTQSLRTGEMCNVFGLYTPLDGSLHPPAWRAVW